MKSFSAEYIRRLFDYDPGTGNLIWKHRPLSDFVNKRAWSVRNSRFAGKAAGSVQTNGYKKIGLDGAQHYAHRLVWAHQTGNWPSSEIDHINGNPLDNRIENLRLATRSQNMGNSHSSKGSLRLKGVWFCRTRKKYKTAISRKALGSFLTEEEAHQAYWEAAKKTFGAFANPGPGSPFSGGGDE